jgi:hypothetical protein
VSVVPRRGNIAGVLVEMNGLPMTGESYIAATPAIAALPSRETAPAPSAPARPEVAPKPALPAVPPAATLTPPAPSFPVSLRFDQQTQRFFIEAKDTSGLVVFQLPFKSAVASPGGASSAQTRGQRVNSKA